VLVTAQKVPIRVPVVATRGISQVAGTVPGAGVGCTRRSSGSSMIPSSSSMRVGSGRKHARTSSRHPSRVVPVYRVR